MATTYPLLRYLSLVLDQLAPAEELIDRFTYTPVDAPEEGPATDTSDLVDPATANARWLPWLAQLVGVSLTGLTVTEQRDLIGDPSQAWDHGTTDALAEAAQRGTTGGTGTVTVTPHAGGDPYAIRIGTITAETEVADTFAKLKALAPTWADLEALGSFANAAAPAPIREADVERPAGYRLVHGFDA